MKIKNLLLTGLSFVLVAAVAIGGTLAYLTSQDSDVNVMTLGNVNIKQHEFERDTNADGSYITDTIDGQTSYVLKEFTQCKPLYPFVGEVNNGYDPIPVRLSQLGHNSRGGMDVFPAKNVQDKFVVVENTGKSDAYVRTIVAFEAGSVSNNDWQDIINYSHHFTWIENRLDTVVDINGNIYIIIEFVYNGYQDIQHPNGVLKPGDYTYNSLAQVYMFDTATNEDCEALDGNNNGQFDILVLSQAIQTNGFENAKTALDTGFGEFNETNVKAWFGGFNVPVAVNSVQELKDAMLIRGANIILNDDIVVDKDTPLQWGAYMFVSNGREVTIDLNGNNIIVEENSSLKTHALFTTANGGTLNIVGEGTVEVKNGQSGIFHSMNANDQINVYGGTYISNSNNGNNALAIIYTNSGNVDVYGGKFIPFDNIECANAEDKQGNRLSIVFHEGTLLKHSKYYAGSDATRIQLEEGCTLKEVQIDGETWYQVVSQ